MNLTKALRAYNDRYGILHAIGLNSEGELDYNEERATERNKIHFANSVDISHYGLYQEQGYLLPAGKDSGKGLAVYRDESGEVVSKEGVEVDDTLKAVYALTEKARKIQ